MERERERKRGRELEERRIFFTAIKFCQTTNHLQREEDKEEGREREEGGRVEGRERNNTSVTRYTVYGLSGVLVGNRLGEGFTVSRGRRRERDRGVRRGRGRETRKDREKGRYGGRVVFHTCVH